MNFSSILEQKFPPVILRLGKELGALADPIGLGVVVVGGGVRDLLLNWPFEEADFMIEFPAESVVEQFARRHGAKVVTHDRFKTFSLRFSDGLKLDIATARRERYPVSAQLPEVEVGASIKIKDDLFRRDFTVNTMAIWMNQSRYGELLDLYDGVGDVKRKTIKALHSESFVDDPTRIFRAARFAGRYGFSVDMDTERWILDSIRQTIPLKLTAVRRRHEFDLILRERNPEATLKILHGWNALVCLHPDWKFPNMETNPFRFFDQTFEQRLVQWFGQFGKDPAAAMMTDLAYEKKVKNIVLNSFV